MAEVQHADPRTRRATIAYVAVGTVVAAGALLLFESYRQSILSWLSGTSPQTQIGVICLALIVLCAPMLLIAAWTWRYGVRVLRTNRHPPEGARLVRDTTVARGAAARRYGRLYQSLATLFVLAALFIVGVAWALWRLGRGPGLGR
jgi:hypothetical protein